MKSLTQRIFFCCLSTLFLLSYLTTSAQQATLGYKINPKGVTIARDTWGTPHIFAKTDPEVAYGLAWANAEDHFETIQEALALGKGLMGRIQGRKGAPTDFFVEAIRARELVDEKYDTEVSDEYKAYLEGYCQGANAFAKAHKDRVVHKKLFPVEPKDILVTYMVSFAALNDVAGAVERAVTGKNDIKEEPLALGSNAFALSSSRTADGRTYLCINPHFKLSGPLSFYEAHLQSEEGLNVTGALFQGGNCVFMGSNENLGWGMTYNYFDAVDSYRLKMHPKKKRRYEVDGKWLKLKKKPIWLKVKVGKITVPVKRMTYQSIHGPTLRSENGQYYAIRAPSLQTIQSAEQFYQMDKASNFDEFQDALDMQGITKFNIVYADKDDNIYFVSNGGMPVRDTSFNSRGVMPGHRRLCIWDRCYTVSELPHKLNPECGYVFNTNNSPFVATCEEEQDNPDRLPGTVDLRPGNNNRAVRFMELVNEKPTFTLDEFTDIKFDNKFSKNSYFYETLSPLLGVDPKDYPELADIMKIVHEWDLVADRESVGATAFELTLNYVFEKKGYGDNAFVTGCDCDEALFAKGLQYAKQHLMDNFGTLEVPLKHFHRYVYDGKDYETYGYPDVLSATYAKPWKKGKYKLIFGDSFTQIVAFGPEGRESVRSLLPYGKTSFDPAYESQLDLYNDNKLKPAEESKEKILEAATSVYNPE